MKFIAEKAFNFKDDARYDSKSLKENQYEITGKFIKTARFKEEWYEDVENPEAIVKRIKKKKIRVDIFTFWQRLPDIEPRYQYHNELEYIAALPIVTYKNWLTKQINAKTRNMVRKAEKKGVITKEVEFNDEFVYGMAQIFNETPIRQGKRFWHYGKDFNVIKKEFSRYLYREKLIGAYYKTELIGFIMLAKSDRYALTGQIISMIKHRDKSPNNALIAKAVQICEREKIPYLVYYNWGNKGLADFKRRNGFKKIGMPRYYIPVTLKGKLSVKAGLHKGIVEAFPTKLRNRLINLRKYYYTRKQ